MKSPLTRDVDRLRGELRRVEEICKKVEAKENGRVLALSDVRQEVTDLAEDALGMYTCLKSQGAKIESHVLVMNWL